MKFHLFSLLFDIMRFMLVWVVSGVWHLDYLLRFLRTNGAED